MPSVGTLNLTVESNAGEVGKSLGALAGALERIQKAVPTGGLGLGQIASEVSSFITQINKIKSASTAFKSIEQLGNGLKGIAQTVKYSTDSIKEASEGTNKAVSSINTKPIVTAIKELKSAIGEGFKIGTAGVQLVKIKDALGGEWDTSKAKSVSAILRDIADASREVGSSNILSVATGINELSKAIEQYAEISNRYKKVSENVNDQLAEAANVGGAASGLTSFQMMIGQRAPLQIFGGRGSKHSEGQIAIDIPELQKQTEGLVEVQSRIEKTTESIDGLKQSVVNTLGPVKALDLDKYIGTPIESIKNKVELGGTAMERFWDTFAIKAPSQSAAAMEKAVAGNASMARQEIKSLIDTLDKPIKYKGLSEFINVKTGVTGGSQGGNIINESTTMLGSLVEEQEALEHTKRAITETTDAQVKLNDAGRAYAGIVTVFDEASGSFKQMYVDTSNVKDSVAEAKAQTEDSVSSIKNFIDLTKVPASGKNGVFANAAEEVSYLTGKIEEARLGMQQFDSIEASAAKQMTHGGPMKPDELAFNLQHATEGFYHFAEAEEVYQRALDDALAHARQQTEEMSRMAEKSAAAEPITAATERLNASMKGAADDGMESFKNELQSIAGSTEPAMSKIDLLRNKVEFLKEKLMRLYEMPATDELGKDTGRNNAINETLLKIGAVNEQIQKLIDKSHEAQQAMQFENMKASAADEISQRTPWTAEDVSNIVNYYSQIELLEMKLQGMQDALARDIEANKLDTQQIADRTIAIQNLKEKIEELKNEQEDATGSTFSFGKAWEAAKKGMEKMFPAISGLMKRFKSILTRRAIMAVIRSVTSGIKEGVQNVYEYSKAINGTLAPAMDSAASSIATMKNALGAAAAPLIQAIIPYLRQAVDWFINVLNYANQFFALLRGQATWTRALPATTTAFKKQEKAAKSAGAAIKDLLADWDELNIIQSQNTGGGAGAGATAAEDYLKMFEEVNTFDNKVKDIVKWVKDNMKLIEGIATAIGVAILGWKFSNAFLGSIGDLRSIALEALSIPVGLQLTWTGAYNAGLNGEFDTASLLTTAGGMIMTTVGAALLGWRIAGPWGAVIGGAAGLVASIAVAVTAYYDGERTKKLRDKWGKLHLTQEQIDDLVDSEVTATVKAEIEIVDASVETRMAARIKANGAILKFSQSLQSAKFALEAGTDGTAINTALASAQEAIKAIQAELESSKEGLTLSFTSFKYTDKEGNDVTKKLYSSLSKGENALDSFFGELGKDIARLISKGFDEGLSEEEQLMALNLMETLQRVTNQAERNYEINKLVRDSKHEMENVYDLETAEGVFNTQQERLNHYKQTRYNQIKEDLEDRNRELEYYKAIQDVYKERGDTAKVEEYAGYIKDSLTAIDNLDKAIEEMENGTYKWDLDEMYSVMYKNMQEGWKNKLTEWFRQGVYDSIFNEKESPFENNPIATNIMEQFGLSSSMTLSDKDIEDIVSKVKELYPVEGNEAMSQLLALGHLLKHLPGERGNVKVRDEFDLIKNVDFEKIVESFIKFDITPENYKQLIDRFWEYIFTDPARDAKDAMNESVQEWTPPANTGKYKAERFSANNMSVDMGAFTDRYDTNPSDPYASGGLIQIMQQFAEAASKSADETDMAKAVETGTNNANRDQNELIRDAITILRQILAKPLTVNIGASSALGLVNGASAVMASKITGG